MEEPKVECLHTLHIHMKTGVISLILLNGAGMSLHTSVSSKQMGS